MTHLRENERRAISNCQKLYRPHHGLGIYGNYSWLKRRVRTAQTGERILLHFDAFGLILNKDESVTCSPENLKSICEKFLPKFHYSTLQLQDGSVGPTKLEWEIIYQRLVVEKRGGLCYERDEVLWQLLTKIGFEVWGEELCNTLKLGWLKAIEIWSGCSAFICLISSAFVE